MWNSPFISEWYLTLPVHYSYVRTLISFVRANNPPLNDNHGHHSTPSYRIMTHPSIFLKLGIRKITTLSRFSPCLILCIIMEFSSRKFIFHHEFPVHRDLITLGPINFRPSFGNSRELIYCLDIMMIYLSYHCGN